LRPLNTVFTQNKEKGSTLNVEMINRRVRSRLKKTQQRRDRALEMNFMEAKTRLNCYLIAEEQRRDRDPDSFLKKAMYWLDNDLGVPLTIQEILQQGFQ